MCQNGKCGTVTNEDDVPDIVKSIVGTLITSIELANGSLEKFKDLAVGHYAPPTKDETEPVLSVMAQKGGETLERLIKLDGTIEGFGMNPTPLIELATHEAAVAGFLALMQLRGQIKQSAKKAPIAA